MKWNRKGKAAYLPGILKAKWYQISLRFKHIRVRRSFFHHELLIETIRNTWDKWKLYMASNFYYLFPFLTPISNEIKWEKRFQIAKQIDWQLALSFFLNRGYNRSHNNVFEKLKLAKYLGKKELMGNSWTSYQI